MAEEKKDAAPTEQAVTPVNPTIAPAPSAPAGSDTKISETIGTPAPRPAPQTGMDFQGTIMMILPMILIFYFLLIRPEQKRKNAQLAMLEQMKKGNKVIIGGMIYGTVSAIDGDEITVIIDPDKNTRMRVRKDAIVGVVDPEKKVDEKK